MRKALIAFVAASFLFMGLTPQERQLATKALAEVQTGRERTKEAAAKVQEAETERDAAKNYARNTADNLGTLQAQVDQIAEREKKLVVLVNELQEEHKRVHSYWGIGAITLGISILSKHLFVAAIVVLALGAILWIVSLTPWGAFVGVALRAASGFIRMIGAVVTSVFRKIKERFQKK